MLSSDYSSNLSSGKLSGSSHLSLPVYLLRPSHYTHFTQHSWTTLHLFLIGVHHTHNQLIKFISFINPQFNKLSKIIFSKSHLLITFPDAGSHNKYSNQLSRSLGVHRYTNICRGIWVSGHFYSFVSFISCVASCYFCDN